MTDSEKIAISIDSLHQRMMRDAVKRIEKGMPIFEGYTLAYVSDVPLCRQYLDEYLAVAKPMLAGFQEILAHDTPPSKLAAIH